MDVVFWHWMWHHTHMITKSQLNLTVNEVPIPNFLEEKLSRHERFSISILQSKACKLLKK